VASTVGAGSLPDQAPRIIVGIVSGDKTPGGLRPSLFHRFGAEARNLFCACDRAKPLELEHRLGAPSWGKLSISKRPGCGSWLTRVPAQAIRQYDAVRSGQLSCARTCVARVPKAGCEVREFRALMTWQPSGFLAAESRLGPRTVISRSLAI